jgi:AMP-polyphosphate phosphotransferase
MLDRLDLSLSLEKDQYKNLLKEYQKSLSPLADQVYLQQRSVVIVLEGWDTAGKSSVIHRIIENIDPRIFRVYAINSPNDIEKSHHYLWRFWKMLPEKGQIAIFDHSWYGRVLNDRVEGNCTEDEWQRAYREINSFERQLVDFGTIIKKFWLHIDKQELINRLEIRNQQLEAPRNITGSDWNDYEKWDIFTDAVNDMLLKTNPVTANWTIVESNSKTYSRIKIIKSIVETLIQELEHDSEKNKVVDNENKSKKKKQKKK